MSNRLRGRFPNRSSNRVPSWVLTAGGVNASLDIDFVNDLAFNSSISTIASLLTCTRASPATTYYTTATGTLTSFAANTLRYGTNGLLVEESRTNKVLQSGNFSATWTNSGLTITSGQTSPDGTANATLLSPSSSGSNRESYQLIAYGTAVTHALSVYAKASGKSWLFLGQNDVTGGAGCWFNVSTGVVGTVGTGYTASIEALANGWYRCIATKSLTTEYFVLGIVDSDASSSVTASGSNGIVIFGPQAEAGSFATSYIPTTSGSVTRSADAVTMNTSAIGGFSTSAGTLYLESGLFDTSNSDFMSLDDGTANNSVFLGSSRLYVGVGGVLQVNITRTATTVTEKIAGAFAVNDSAAYNGGAQTGTDAVCTMPMASVTTLRLGRNSANTSSGYIKRAAYWPSRISNANLAILTSYVLADSTFDIDFVNNLAYTRSYLGQSTRTSVSISSLLTCTRAAPATTYYTTSTGTLTGFAANTLRYGDQGLLVEEARTNALTRSQEFDNAAWTASNITKSGDVAVAPDGTTTADGLIVNNGQSFVSANNSGATTASAAATFSVFVKNNGAGKCVLRLDNNNNMRATFNLSTGAITAVGASITSSAVETLASGWYRCKITATVSSTTTAVSIFPGDWGDVGDGVVGIYVWGAQLEIGSFATSYIPTTTGSVARSADVVTYSGTLPTVVPGAIYCQATLTDAVSAHRIWQFNLNNTGNNIDLYAFSSVFNGQVDGATNAYNNRAAAAGTYKTALAFANADQALVLSGAAANTATASIATISQNKLQLGNSLGASQFLDGHIREIAFWPTRIGNTNLQTLTA